MNINSLVPLLLGRWGMGFAGVILLALMLWHFGPLWPQLSSPLARIAVVAVLLLIWAGPNLWIDRRRRNYGGGGG